MVCDTVKPSLRAASCCRVDVVNGGAGVRFSGFLVIALAVTPAVFHFSKNAITSSCVLKRLSSSAFSSDIEPSGASTPNMALTRK